MVDAVNKDQRATSRLPPFRCIEAFVVSAKLLTFTSAAGTLHLTVPAVSRRIKTLEAELGVMLFHREHRTLRLTRAGKAYFETLSPAIDAIRLASDTVRVVPRRNVVKVSVLPTFATSWLFPRLHSFKSKCKDVQVEFDTSIDYVGFDHSDIDLAIRLGNGDWPGLHVERLFKVTAFPLCSSSLAEGSHAARTVSELMKFPLLGSNHQPDLWPTWLRLAGADEHVTPKYINFDSFYLAYEAAACGLGFAIGLGPIAEPYLKNDRLVRPFILECDLHKRFYLVGRAYDRDRPAVRAFRSWLIDQAASWQNRSSIAAGLTQRSQSSIARQNFAQ